MSGTSASGRASASPGSPLPLVISPRSTSRRTISSVNKGLPSPCSTIRAARPGGTSSRPMRRAISARVSAPDRGRRSTSVSASPTCDRALSTSRHPDDPRSGRAAMTTRTGSFIMTGSSTSRASTDASSAQCASSSTTTAGVSAVADRSSAVTAARKWDRRASGLTSASRAASSAESGSDRSRVRLARSSASSSPAITASGASSSAVARFESMPYGESMPYDTPRASYQAIGRAGMPPALARSSASRRLLPTPGSPTTIAARPRPASISSSSPARRVHSSSRPTSGRVAAASARTGATISRASTISHASTGTLLPFAAMVPSGRPTNAWATYCHVSAVTSTVPGRAAASTRAATFTVSPRASSVSSPGRSPSTIARPVLTPTLTSGSTPSAAVISRSSAAIPDSMSRAACTPRIASSSCATGAPKIANTPSPAIEVTRPP